MIMTEKMKIEIEIINTIMYDGELTAEEKLDYIEIAIKNIIK